VWFDAAAGNDEISPYVPTIKFVELLKMTDLFDIANLITTVGVDGVKIKSEPGLPEKSSNEILTELFSTFDAPDDGVASPENQQIPNDIKSKLDKLLAKKKKKKHKHKEKKHKKRSRHNSSDSNSDVEGNNICNNNNVCIQYYISL